MRTNYYVILIISIILTAAGMVSAEQVGFDGALAPLGGAVATGTRYMLTDNYGGSWFDAEKTQANTEDDLMCWAAAASNVLAWTGWGDVSGLSGADSTFGYFQDHWTDEGSLPEFGWQWFFDGTNAAQGYSGWSQVDVAGGGFWPQENLYGDLFHDNWTGSGWDADGAMGYVDSFLRAGYGTTMAVYSDTIAHAITAWGFNYNPLDSSDYYGIWITDSDDDKYDATPEDELKYFELSYHDSKWFLQDYYGYDDIYIGGVQSLAPLEGYYLTVPEPATISLVSMGVIGLLKRRKRQ
jgi:hypothetical protein